MGQLSAPFPYYGGKARQADAVWRELGDVTVYAEPFAGSLAVLLASEPHRREIVCDTDGHIVNFWRALRNDPAGVALHVDYPTFHQDLRARHLWLRRWGKENDDRLSEDPEWFDSRAAGWWVWGISSWIGGGWCQAVGDRTDKRPLAKPKDGGQDVQVQRENLPVDKRPLVHANGGRPGVQVQRTGLPDSIPRVTSWPGGNGVQAQRESLPSDRHPMASPTGGGRGVQAQRTGLPWDKRPQVDSRGLGGRGVQAQRQRTEDKRDDLALEVGTGERLSNWFHHLAQRLARVVVLNRSWESAVTPTFLMHTPTSPQPPVGIFMDPPYPTARRQRDIYQSDYHGESDAVAVDAYLWALRHGDRYRIAFCCHEGDFPLPTGWRAMRQTFGGIKRSDRRDNTDMVMFSPACVGAAQTASQGRLSI